MENLIKVVRKIRPDAEFSISNDNLIWHKNGSLDLGEPTQAEIDAALLALDKESYKDDRKADYEAQGLTFNSFVEMLIKDDTAGMAQYRSKRAAIKLNHKKPAL